MADLGAAPLGNVVTSGPPYQTILKLALPTVGAMMSQSLVNEIDIVFFGRLGAPESANAQAALMPCLIVLWLFGGSLSAISVGTQALVARRFAEKKDEEAGAVMLNAFAFSLVAGVAFTILGFLLRDPILGQLIKVDGARQTANGYMNFRLLGITSMAATSAFKSFFDGLGKTHVHLVSAVVMNVINIGACLLFIFGNETLHLKPMGMAGAGLGAVLSTWIGLGVMVVYAVSASYRKRFRPFDLSKLSKKLLGQILRLSVPSAIATIAVMTGFALFVGIASRLDKLHPLASDITKPINSAATTVIIGVLKLTITACLAFGTATATLVSQSLGEKDPTKAERFGWTSVRLALVIFGVVGVAQAVFANPILHFVSHDPDVVAAGLIPMRVMGICTPGIAVGMILTQALFGAGNTRFVMVVELLLHFGILVPLAYLLGITLNLGLVGQWMAAVTYVVLLAIVMAVKFRLGGWKKIAL